jgi:vacuolar-type H+-ATPase subunit H
VAGQSRLTTDHDKIRRWAEERGGEPATVKGTGSDGKPGVLRIHFPGHGADESLVEISWDAFFEKFEHEKLAFLYQETLHSGEISRFHRFVQRHERREKAPQARGAGDLDAAQQALYQVMQIEDNAVQRLRDAEGKARQIADDANKNAEEIVQAARSDAQHQADKIQADAESAARDQARRLLKEAESEIEQMQSAADAKMESAVAVLVDWVIARRERDG